MTNNAVVIENAGTQVGAVYGGYSVSGSANTNNVTVQNGGCLYVSPNVCAMMSSVYGGYSEGTGDANGNTVTINSGAATGSVYGGYSKGTGSADSNKLYISDKALVGAGGAGIAVGGRSEKGSADSNEMTISGGRVTGGFFGGYGKTSADYNSVTITGGTIDTNAYGFVAAGYATAAAGSASHNTITYSGGSIDGLLYGGFVGGGGTSTDNTLNIEGKDLSADNIGYFQNLNFLIPAAAVNNDVLLQLSDPTGQGIKLDNMTVKAGVKGGSQLQPGDKIVLLKDTGAGIISDTNTTYSYGSLLEGVSLEYQLTFSKSEDNKSLLAIIAEGVQPVMKPETKSLIETQAVGVALIDSGMDQLAGMGIANAVQAADKDGRYAYTPFAVMGGESMRYHTGSYIDSKGWNIGLGLVRSVNNAEGRLTFGPVISYGHSNYDSYLDAGLHADGTAHYTGIGFLLRQDDKDGLYYEGSFGGGQLKSDYNSSDLATSYDASANYYAFHAGIGKVQKLSSSASLDYYGKYFYSHQCASSATLATGEDYHFDSIDSNRVRIGARVENAYSDRASLYYGAAWEYEFGGEARATYKGLAAPSPSLKGGSGLAEIGWKVKPYKDSPFAADLSLTGWEGKKEGFSLNAMLTWEIL